MKTHNSLPINLHITEGLFFSSKRLGFSSFSLFIKFINNKMKLNDVDWVINSLKPLISDLVYWYGMSQEIAIEYIFNCVLSGFASRNITLSINMIEVYGKCF